MNKKLILYSLFFVCAFVSNLKAQMLFFDVTNYDAVIEPDLANKSVTGKVHGIGAAIKRKENAIEGKQYETAIFCKNNILCFIYFFNFKLSKSDGFKFSESDECK